MNRYIYCFSVFITLLLLAPSTLLAQNSFTQRIGRTKIPERGVVIVVGGGIAAIKSDICGSPGCNNYGPNASVGAWYKISPYLSMTGSVDYVRLGADEKNPNRPLNISFQSEIIEVTSTAVLNLIDSYAGSGNYRSSRKRFLVPYIRAGAGFVYYTPTSYPGQGNLEDSQSKYDPERNYPAIAAVIPFGGGMRFRFSDEISVTGELIYHITTTDYLDNIGPRLGNPNNKDHYGVAAIKVMYTPVLKNNIFSKKSQRD